MKVVSVAAVVFLVGCVEQPAERLEASEQKPVQVSPSDSTPPVAGELLLNATLLQLAPPPSVSASALLKFVPLAATSVSEVSQVEVAFEVTGVGAPSVAALEFVSPGGSPYDRQETAVEGTAFTSHHFAFVLPVAATAIDTGRLSGAWSARLSIDGAVVKIQTFELTP